MTLLGLAFAGCSSSDKGSETPGTGVGLDPSTASDVDGGADSVQTSDAGSHVGGSGGNTGGTTGGTSTGSDTPSDPCRGSCTAGQTCNRATAMCEPVASCKCQPGTHCDTATNTCAPGCRADSDCASGQTCNVAMGSCIVPTTCNKAALPNLTLRQVFINQAVEIPLFDKGTQVAVKSRPAPIVQNRRALVRVLVTPGANYTPVNVVAELTLDNGGKKTVVRSTQMVTTSSDESKLDGTINLDVTAESIGPDTKYSVALTTAECVMTESDGRFASTGELTALAAEKTGRVKVVVVPYERAPYKLNTSPEAIQALKDGIYAYYPTEGIDIEVREAIPVRNASTDLQRILQNIRSVRAQDMPSDDTYYFGLFTAAATLRDFCGNGCVAGIATLGGDGTFGDPSERYGVGIGYISDVMTTSMGKPTTEREITINTMAHELGHDHGRQHAPCGGPAGVDPRFPNKTAAIDTYGYSLLTGKFATPTTHTDIMAYCEPNWIHPYTYSAIAKRIQGVNGNNRKVIQGTPKRYAQLVVEQSGRYVWGEDVMLDATPAGMVEYARAFDVAGKLVDGAVPITVSELADVHGVLVTLAALDPNWMSLEIRGHHITIEQAEL